MIARLAVVAALAGSAAGAAVVLADEPGPRKSAPPAVAAAAQPTPTHTPKPLVVRDPRVLTQVADPEGGPRWAIRRFTSERTDCWELGRIQGEQFGWIDGDGAFAAHEPGHQLLPFTCYAPKQLTRIGAAVGRITTIKYAAGRAAQPGTSVTWGPAADEIIAVTPDGEPRIEIGPDHLILQVKAGPVPPLRRGVFERRDGTTKRFDYYDVPKPRPGQERTIPGTEEVVVRAPDPAGGEPWGMVVQRGSRGSVCSDGPQRLIGDQPGFIDGRLDTYTPSPFFTIHCGRSAPTRAYPMRLTTLLSSIPESDDRGRIERRVLEGRLVIHGRVHESVVAVTIRSPRDVRTLIPSKDGFVMAVYDGQFPGGKVTATARLRDGKEVTRSLYVG